MSKQRIFYFGLINTPHYCKSRALDLYVGAAAGKMMGVIAAMHAVRLYAYLVTLPVLRAEDSVRYQNSCFSTKDGVPVLFLETHANKWLRFFFGLFGFAKFALTRVNSTDRVIVYNYRIEYILALIVLNFRRIRVFQDIEDLPIKEEKWPSGLLNYIGYKLVSLLTIKRKITVSHQIAESEEISDYLPVYGVFPSVNKHLPEKVKTKSKSMKGTLRIHYGGTLQETTGIDLFVTSVLLLESQIDLNKLHFCFVVTGVGELEKVRSLRTSLRSEFIRIEIHESVSREDYLALLRSCHASLALKVPSANISLTTFPSKVIEIVSNYVALVSTKVSDVPLIFDESNSFLLDEATPIELTSVFLKMARSPEIVLQRAYAGYLLAQERFSPEAVGQSLATFLGVRGNALLKMPSVYFWQRIITPHMALLADALAQRGVAVVYVANGEMSYDRQEQGWKPPILRFAQLKIAPDRAAVKKLVAKAPLNSHHLCQGVRGNCLVRITQQQLRRRGLQYWAMIETVDDQGRRGVIKRIVYRTLLWYQRNHLNGILAIGARTPEWITARGFPSLRVFPFAYFLQQPDWTDATHESHDAPAQNRFRFIYVGQLIERKRVDDLISALARLDRDDVELIVVGDGPLKNVLHTQAAKLLPGCVRWLGQQPMPAIPALIAQADCLVLPSRHDGWGAVVSEALMVGTPVVCSDACGSATAVQASGVGGVFASGDKDALVRLMRQCFEKGKVSREERTRTSTWANALGADAGAQYLAEIINHAANGGEKPMPPWIRLMPSARTG